MYKNLDEDLTSHGQNRTSAKTIRLKHIQDTYVLLTYNNSTKNPTKECELIIRNAALHKWYNSLIFNLFGGAEPQGDMPEA